MSRICFDSVCTCKAEDDPHYFFNGCCFAAFQKTWNPEEKSYNHYPDYSWIASICVMYCTENWILNVYTCKRKIIHIFLCIRKTSNLFTRRKSEFDNIFVLPSAGFELTLLVHWFTYSLSIMTNHLAPSFNISI